MKRRIFVVMTLSGLLVASTAALVAGDAASNGLRRHGRVRIAIYGGTHSQQTLLRHLANNSGAISILTAQIGAPPAGYQEAPQLQVYGQAWLYVAVRTEAGGAAWVMPYWQAQLLAGAFRDQSHAQGLPDLLGESVSVVSSTGSILHEDSNVIAGPFTHAVDEEPQDQIARRLDGRIAALQGIRSSTVSFETPLFAAPAVKLSVSDGSVFLRDNSVPMLANHIFGDFGSYEGTFLEVDDASGHPLRVGAYASRTQKGVGWNSPDVPQPSLDVSNEPPSP